MVEYISSYIIFITRIPYQSVMGTEFEDLSRGAQRYISVTVFQPLLAPSIN